MPDKPWTVGELIAALNEFPPHVPVYVYSEDNSEFVAMTAAPCLGVLRHWQSDGTFKEIGPRVEVSIRAHQEDFR